MADSQRIFDPGARFVDANGDPLAGGTLYFYQAGTSTPRTVYTDADLIVALGTSCTLDSGGYPTTDGNTKTLIHTGTSDYKVILKDGDGNTIATHDNIKGALDTSGFSTTYAIGTSPVLAKTSAYTITTDDEGKHIACDPTGGSFALTLPSAVTAGDGFRIPFSHNADSDNVVYFVVQGSQTIGGKSGYIIRRRSGGTLVSDGANWRVESDRTPFFEKIIPIVDRLTVAPASPNPGAYYLLNGTATGTWATLGFDQHDILEADGIGGWIQWVPSDGWTVYIRDENKYAGFYDTAWDDWDVAEPEASNLEHAVWEYQVSNGTSGGTATTNAWTTRGINTEVVNTITGASLASNQVTLPVGRYFASMSQSFSQTQNTLSRLKAISGTVDVPELRSVPHTYILTDGGGDNVTISIALNHSGFINVTATAVVELQYYVTNAGTGSGQGLGIPSSESENDVETYVRLSILKLDSLQGPVGEQGLPGASSGVFYTFDTSTTMADPGAGDIRLNHATLSSVTGAAISVNTAETANPSIAGFIAQWDQSTTTALRGVLIIKEFGSSANYAIYSITGASTNNTTWYQLSLTHLASNGSFAASDQLSIEFYRTGNAGGGDVTAAGNFSADNTLIRADGTGKGVQGSGLAVSDSDIFTGSVGLLSSHASAPIGHAAGAGGTVTQATSKSTGVSQNGRSGEITMNNASLNNATSVSFTLTNTSLTAADVLVINLVSGGTAGAYTFGAACASGSAVITVRNVTAGALGEALVLRYIALRVATS